MVLMLLVCLSHIIDNATFRPTDLWAISKHLMVTVAGDYFLVRTARCIGHEGGRAAHHCDWALIGVALNRVTVLAVALIVVLFAANDLASLGCLDVIGGEQIVMFCIHADFSLGVEALPAIGDSIICRISLACFGYVICHQRDRISVS